MKNIADILTAIRNFFNSLAFLSLYPIIQHVQ